MKNKSWGSFAEIIGLVSIVAGLILVAWEIHQANNIAKAQMVMDLAAQANEFNSATFENPDVADLLTAISDQDQVDVSETQRSMMTGVTWHFTNIFWSAQKAYDSGLLGDDDILMYQSSLAWMLEYRPGLREGFISIHDTSPWIRDMYVFQPLADISCKSKNDCVDLLEDE